MALGVAVDRSEEVSGRQCLLAVRAGPAPPHPTPGSEAAAAAPAALIGEEAEDPISVVAAGAARAIMARAFQAQAGKIAYQQSTARRQYDSFTNPLSMALCQPAFLALL